MIQEKLLLPYTEWLLDFGPDRIGALWQFLLTIGVVLMGGAIIALVVSSILHGPAKGGERVYRMFANAGRELFDISPRRVLALSRLAVYEAWRSGRVWIVLALFLILLLFAGWFVKPEREPAKLLLSLVLSATSFLSLVLAVVLAVFSLPTDFKNKTIYTVVTKPVRSGEMVLGRIIGFSAIGTVLIALMGVASYWFVSKSLDHRHDIVLENGALPEFTTIVDGHRHQIVKDEQGGYTTSLDYDHYHTITERNGRYMMSEPIGLFGARVPHLGEISFLSRQGVPERRGISVGKEWTYRSFIEGGTQGAAIWTFEGIDESMLEQSDDGGQYLPIELIVRVFRTYKADIVTPIQGSIQLRRPGTNLTTTPQFFYAKDASIDTRYFSRKLTNNQPPNDTIDLIDDLVVDGKIEVVVQCLNPGQYFGFARGDCYIRLDDGSPTLSFVKAYLGIWVQMVLVIAIAVMASTFLSGPIALLFTGGFIVLGLYRDTFLKIALGEQEGGGPIESFVRIVTGMNMVSEFREVNFGVNLMRVIDNVLKKIMELVANVVPDFSKFGVTNYIADGFDVPTNLIMQQMTIGLAYVVGMSIMGYFLLRNREVAR
jgi:hypothetical protein